MDEDCGDAPTHIGFVREAEIQGRMEAHRRGEKLRSGDEVFAKAHAIIERFTKKLASPELSARNREANMFFLLVDEPSNCHEPELQHLLSFAGVDGLTIEHHVTINAEANNRSRAIVGANGTRVMGLAPLEQFGLIAARMATDDECGYDSVTVQRAMAFSFLAERLGADAAVSPAAPLFVPERRGLLKRPLLTVSQALAVLGPHVRQRGTVPLGGRPMLFQERSEVYRLTAKLIVPHGQEWWSSCVATADKYSHDLVGYGQAVFGRIGQALRGRDGVHESLRSGQGRSAILDSLYHLDVVLMSSVGAFDALAKVADVIFGIGANPSSIAWQRDKWQKQLSAVAPGVAGIVAEGTLGVAVLKIITAVRNSIHGIPLDEYLSVEVGSHSNLVEHRTMLSSDLAGRLASVAGVLSPLEKYGLFLESAGTSFLNVATFAESVLTWTTDLVDQLMVAMLGDPRMLPGRVVSFDEIEQLEQRFCSALARVGEYPHSGGKGLPASPSLHRSISATLYKARKQLGKE